MNKLVPKIDNSIRDPIIRYSGVIPDIISDAISGLNNRNYRAIIVILDIEGRKSFTELRKKLNLRKNESNKLSYWLDKLEEEGLVINDIIKIPNKRESSFYSLSEFGKDLLDKILEAYWNYVSPIVTIPKEEMFKDLEPSSSIEILPESTEATQNYQHPIRIYPSHRDEKPKERIKIEG